MFQIEWRIPIIRRKTSWHSRQLESEIDMNDFRTREFAAFLQLFTFFPLSLSLSLFSIRVCSSKKRIYILGCRILLFIFLFLLLLLFSSSVNDPSFLFYRPFLSYSGKGKSVKGDGWKNKREARGRELRELKMTSRESGGVTV